MAEEHEEIYREDSVLLSEEERQTYLMLEAAGEEVEAEELHKIEQAPLRPSRKRNGRKNRYPTQ
jgi:hypothetical protein